MASSRYVMVPTHLLASLVRAALVGERMMSVLSEESATPTFAAGAVIAERALDEFDKTMGAAARRALFSDEPHCAAEMARIQEIFGRQLA